MSKVYRLISRIRCKICGEVIEFADPEEMTKGFIQRYEAKYGVDHEKFSDYQTFIEYVNSSTTICKSNSCNEEFFGEGTTF